MAIPRRQRHVLCVPKTSCADEFGIPILRRIRSSCASPFVKLPVGSDVVGKRRLCKKRSKEKQKWKYKG